VQRDNLLCDDLVETDEGFYNNHILKETPPEIDNEDDIKLASFYYKKFLNSPVKELSTEAIALINERGDLLEQLEVTKPLNKKKDQVNGKLKVYMVDTQCARGGGFKITYKGTIPEGCEDPEKVTRRLYVGKDK
jgi:hypothetical protein